MNPVLGGVLLRMGLQLVAGALATHAGIQVSSGEVDAVAGAVEGAAGAGVGLVSLLLSIKNKKKLGAL